MRHLTDEQLINGCEYAGEQSLKWRWKFLGYLPEVKRRKLYEKRGCASIFEYAAKKGGVSEDLVHRALRLNKKFKHLRRLQRMLERGEVSLHKLARIASIATPENEAELVRKLKTMSQAALEALVQDVRSEKSVRAHTFHYEKVLNLDADVEEELVEMQRRGIDVSGLLRAFLKQRKEDIKQKKAEVGEKMDKMDRVSRYIPAEAKKVLKEEFGDGCSVRGCKKPAEQIHHQRRFALDPSHNPQYLAPLCAGHHELAAQVDDLSVRYKSKSKQYGGQAVHFKGFDDG